MNLALQASKAGRQAGKQAEEKDRCILFTDFCLLFLFPFVVLALGKKLCWICRIRMVGMDETRIFRPSRRKTYALVLNMPSFLLCEVFLCGWL